MQGGAKIGNIAIIGDGGEVLASDVRTDGADAVVAVGSGGLTTRSSLLSVTVPLTAGQINHLFSAPVTLIAPPGVGKVIVPLFVIFAIRQGTIPFGSLNGNDIAVKYLGGDANNFQALDFGAVTGFGLGGDNVSGVFFMPAWSFSKENYNAAVPTSVDLNPLTYPGIADLPLVLFNQGEDFALSGAVAASRVSAGSAGLLYAPGDTFYVDEDNGSVAAARALFTVSTVIGGAVSTYTQTSGGFNHSVANGVATHVLTGAGDGSLKLDVSAVTPGNGSGLIDVTYKILTLP